MDKDTNSFNCYRGLALNKELIEKWTKQKKIFLDGYNSASFDEIVARKFASKMETDLDDQVLLKINMKNETGKYFISLDKPDQTAYPDEKEILL